MKDKLRRTRCNDVASFADLLREYVGERHSDLLFHTSTGALLLQSNALSDSLRPILDYMAHERGGFNILRRFRLTHLEKSDCPEPLRHFWSGHASKARERTLRETDSGTATSV
jgi:hypothetical protein